MANANTVGSTNSASLVNRGYLSTQDASAYLNVSDSTLRDRARAGRLDRQYDTNGRAFYRIFFSATELATRMSIPRGRVPSLAADLKIRSRVVNGRTMYTNL